MGDRTPHFEVKIKHKDAKYGARVGAAWKTQDGRGINIRLDPGISVATPDGVFLTLWPYESKEERESRFANGGGGGQQSQRGNGGGGYGNGRGGYGGGGGGGGAPPEDDFGSDNVPF